jgi:hypothetical protein
MSEVSRDPKPNNTESTGPVKKGGFPQLSLQHILTLVVLAIVIVYNIGEILRTPVVADVATNQSLFAISKEISDRYNVCEYKYLFFCEPKPAEVRPSCENLSGLARDLCEQQAHDTHVPRSCENLRALEEVFCIWTDNGRAEISPERHPYWASIPFIGIIYPAVEILPHLPDAVIYMLAERWKLGHLQFSLGLLFVSAYVTLMVVAFRLDNRMALVLFALAVVFGPYLLLGGFWLFQQALAEASAAANNIAAGVLAGLGLPTCLAICIKHDVGSVGKIIGEVRRGGE